MALSVTIKEYSKTKTLPRRFKVSLKKGKKEASFLLKTEEMRVLIGKLDNVI